MFNYLRGVLHQLMVALNAVVAVFTTLILLAVGLFFYLLYIVMDHLGAFKF